MILNNKGNRQTSHIIIYTSRQRICNLVFIKQRMAILGDLQFLVEHKLNNLYEVSHISILIP